MFLVWAKGERSTGRTDGQPVVQYVIGGPGAIVPASDRSDMWTYKPESCLAQNSVAELQVRRTPSTIYAPHGGLSTELILLKIFWPRVCSKSLRGKSRDLLTLMLALALMRGATLASYLESLITEMSDLSISENDYCWCLPLLDTQLLLLIAIGTL